MMARKKIETPGIRRRRTVESDGDFDDRQHSEGRKGHVSHAPPSGIKSCLQIFVVSSIIPLLFFLRVSQQDEDSYLRRNYARLTVPNELPPPYDFLPDLLHNYMTQLRRWGSENDQEWLESDTAELHHCYSMFTSATTSSSSSNSPDVLVMNWTHFMEWSNKTMPPIQQSRMSREDEETTRQEIILELLEIYGTHYGFCRFHRYKPSYNHENPSGSSSGSNTFSNAIVPSPTGHARLAFVIVVRRNDLAHIQRLIKAVHMPQHYIVLHVDATMNEGFFFRLLELTQEYDNIVVVRFETAASLHNDNGMDSMTHVHLKLMRWLTMDLHLRYDYHITLDDTSFPLYYAEDFARHLFASSNEVWLGKITDQDKEQQPDSYRLVTTTFPTTIALQSTLFDPPKSVDWLSQQFNDRTVSGSTAVFSQSVVRQLLSSSRAMEIFGRSKYACCEVGNYNWMAAMKTLDEKHGTGNLDPNTLKQQAKTQTATFQLQSVTADENCDKASTKRAVATLSNDIHQSFCIEHPSVVKAVHNQTFTSPDFDWTIPNDRRKIHGGPELMKYLQSAKKAGFLFARSFDFENLESVALLNEIERTIIKSS